MPESRRSACEPPVPFVLLGAPLACLLLFAASQAEAQGFGVYQQGARGRTRDAPGRAPPTTDLNTGVYSFSANLFAITLSLGF